MWKHPKLENVRFDVLLHEMMQTKQPYILGSMPVPRTGFGPAFVSVLNFHPRRPHSPRFSSHI